MIDEEDLSEEAKRFVSDAFAKVKFSPGKLNGLAVKSQLSIEISLERAKVAPIPVIMR
ncbi:hypothetical protein LT85_4106 [Collimonas arenae]|uniref:Uncharacterized protein n=1 Tax=Collimonas arenae TaxID=279058 RepID=A0A0A1FI22_9BURK|nr:hypothetical protein LT85_4106 [Collimonas arenae]